MRSPFFNCRVEHFAECSPLPPCYLPQRPCRPTFDPAHRALVAARPVPQAHSRAGSSSDPSQILLPLFDWFLGWISAGVIVAKASAGVRRVFPGVPSQLGNGSADQALARAAESDVVTHRQISEAFSHAVHQASKPVRRHRSSPLGSFIIRGAWRRARRR